MCRILTKIVIFIAVVLLQSCSLLPTSHDNSLDIYLLLGQSNMAGRATISDTEKLPIEHLFTQ